MDLAKMIDEILENYHQKHRDDLEVLIPLSKKVEEVHADHAEVPAGLGEFLEKLSFELENHMQKEEQILFPMLVRDIFPSGPISVMEEEHLEHGQALEKMQALAHNLELPPGACNTWTALYVGLKELKEDLMEHIHLENNILFVNRTEGEGSCCGSCH